MLLFSKGLSLASSGNHMSVELLYQCASSRANHTALLSSAVVFGPFYVQYTTQVSYGVNYVGHVNVR